MVFVNKRFFLLIVSIAVGCFLLPKQASAAISWHQEQGQSVTPLQNEQSVPQCTQFMSEISVTTKEVLEIGVDINNPQQGQPGGTPTFTCLNCGPGASITNDTGSGGLPAVSYGLLTWDTRNVNLQPFVPGSYFKVLAQVGTEKLYGAVCIKVNGPAAAYSSSLSWQPGSKIINLQQTTDPISCNGNFLGELTIGDKKIFTSEISINNSNLLETNFSCVNCGAGASFKEKNVNKSAVLEWNTDTVDLSKFIPEAHFVLSADAGNSERIYGGACVKINDVVNNATTINWVGNVIPVQRAHEPITTCGNKFVGEITKEKKILTTEIHINNPTGSEPKFVCVNCGSGASITQKGNDVADFTWDTTNLDVSKFIPNAVFNLYAKVGNEVLTGAVCVKVDSTKIDMSKAVDQYIADRYSKPTGYDGPLPDCAFTGTCRSVEDLLGLGVKVADWLFSILAGLGFAFFVYGGVTMIFSFGNAEKVGQGKQILVAATIGIIIAFSAYVLVGFIVKAIGINPTLTPFN